VIELVAGEVQHRKTLLEAGILNSTAQGISVLFRP